MAGTFVADPNLRSALWGIDGLGLVVATTILALKYFRSGNDAVAAGFLIFAIGESVMLSGTAQSLEAMVPSFAAGTGLWAAALLLTSVPRTFAGWIRRLRGSSVANESYPPLLHFRGWGTLSSCWRSPAGSGPWRENTEQDRFRRQPRLRGGRRYGEVST
jgi:hypothetical protein